MEKKGSKNKIKERGRKERFSKHECEVVFLQEGSQIPEITNYYYYNYRRELAVLQKTINISLTFVATTNDRRMTGTKNSTNSV